MPTDGLSEAVCLIFIPLPGDSLTHWDLATIYPWFCVLTVVATLIAVRVAVGSLYPEVTSRAGLVNAAAVTTAVFIEGTPVPTENVGVVRCVSVEAPSLSDYHTGYSRSGRTWRADDFDLFIASKPSVAGRESGGNVNGVSRTRIRECNSRAVACDMHSWGALFNSSGRRPCEATYPGPCVQRRPSDRPLLRAFRK